MANSLLKIASGRMADRSVSKRPIVLFGYSISSSVRPLIALATSWVQVFTARVSIVLERGSAERRVMRCSPPGRANNPGESVWIPSRDGPHGRGHRSCPCQPVSVVLSRSVSNPVRAHRGLTSGWRIPPAIIQIPHETNPSHQRRRLPIGRHYAPRGSASAFGRGHRRRAYRRGECDRSRPDVASSVEAREDRTTGCLPSTERRPTA